MKKTIVPSPCSHCDQLVSLSQQAFEPPTEQRLVNYGASEFGDWGCFALLDIAHVHHLLRQLAVLVGLVFGFVVLEVLLLVDSVI